MTNVRVILQHFPDTTTFLGDPLFLYASKPQPCGQKASRIHMCNEAWQHMQTATHQEELCPGYTTTK